LLVETVYRDSKINRIILFALVLLPFTNYSIDKSVDWLPPHSNLRFRINLDTRLFEQEISTDQWKTICPVTISDTDWYLWSTKPNHADYFYLSNDLIRFAIQGTGLVFDFNLTNAQLTRADRTIHSGYNFGASRFYRNKVLYSIGGEGFWSYNRQITFFDDKMSKEWEILRPKNAGPERISDGFQGYSSRDDAFYSGGSSHKNFLEDEKSLSLEKFNDSVLKIKPGKY